MIVAFSCLSCCWRWSPFLQNAKGSACVCVRCLWHDHICHTCCSYILVGMCERIGRFEVFFSILHHQSALFFLFSDVLKQRGPPSAAEKFEKPCKNERSGSSPQLEEKGAERHRARSKEHARKVSAAIPTLWTHILSFTWRVYAKANYCFKG